MTVATQANQDHYPKAFTPEIPTHWFSIRTIGRALYPYLCVGWIALLLLGSLLTVHLHHQSRRLTD